MIRFPRKFSLLLLAAAAAASQGCIAASLASDTGPRPPERLWSIARRQMVHVGEEVRFDLVLKDWLGRFVNPLGSADYCVVTIGADRLEADADLDGHFRFSYSFDRVRSGDTIMAEAVAFKQYGGRDFMRIRGRWMESDSPYELTDRRVASDKIRFTAYQVPIEFSLVRPPDDLKPETGVLTIHRANAPAAAVYLARPRRDGFTISDPGPDGYYHVRYQPTGDELNPTGTTEVEFTIYDMVGQPHRARATLTTP